MVILVVLEMEVDDCGRESGGGGEETVIVVMVVVVVCTGSAPFPRPPTQTRHPMSLPLPPTRPTYHHLPILSHTQSPSLSSISFVLSSSILCLSFLFRNYTVSFSSTMPSLSFLSLASKDVSFPFTLLSNRLISYLIQGSEGKAYTTC